MNLKKAKMISSKFTQKHQQLKHRQEQLTYFLGAVSQIYNISKYDTKTLRATVLSEMQRTQWGGGESW